MAEEEKRNIELEIIREFNIEKSKFKLGEDNFKLVMREKLQSIVEIKSNELAHKLNTDKITALYIQILILDHFHREDSEKRRGQ